MEKDGTTSAFMNKGINNWVNVGQVKQSEGYDRANIDFADTNGSYPFSFVPLTFRDLKPGREFIDIIFADTFAPQATGYLTSVGPTSSLVM